MVGQRPQLANNEIYHIVSRAVGDTEIFKNVDNYYRGVFSLYEFNTTELVTIQKRRELRLRLKKQSRSRTPTEAPVGVNSKDERDKLVEVLSFSLIPNHIHLLLRQLKDNGISHFIQKVGTGYANYFNKKYNRKGHLFNKFQPVHIKTEEQLKNVFVYIHTNRISLIEPNWKEIGIKNPRKVIEFLENDKWHSYPDYLGKKNFPSVTTRDFLLEVMGGIDGCREEVGNWIKHKKEIREFGDIILE